MTVALVNVKRTLNKTGPSLPYLSRNCVDVKPKLLKVRQVGGAIRLGYFREDFGVEDDLTCPTEVIRDAATSLVLPSQLVFYELDSAQPARLTHSGTADSRPNHEPPPRSLPAAHPSQYTWRHS
jgi:hypothetical protein